MPITNTPNPHNAAERHFRTALAFYSAHDQQGSAIGELTAGLLALSVQVARIELAVMVAEGHDC